MTAENNTNRFYNYADMDLEQRAKKSQIEGDENSLYKVTNYDKDMMLLPKFANISKASTNSNKELMRPTSINSQNNNELKRLDNYYNSSKSDVDLISNQNNSNSNSDSRPDLNIESTTTKTKLLKFAAADTDQAEKSPIIKTMNDEYFDQKKNLFKTKRRNTISTIGLGKIVLSQQQMAGKNLISSNLNIFRSSQNSLTNKPSIERMSINVTGSNHKDSNDLKDYIVEINKMDIFEIIQLENVDYLKKKISIDPKCLDRLNEVNFSPLDIVLMLNNVDLFQVLLNYGALEKTDLLNWSVRYDRVCDQLTDLNSNLTNLLEHFDVPSLSLEEITEYNNKFKEIDLKIKLYKKMKLFLESCEYPSQIENVRLEVYSSTSLMVTFDDESASHQSAIIIKYLFEWSSNPYFESLDGRKEMSFKDGSKKQYLIQNLTTSKVYYVRVACMNIRGFGSYANSFPPFAIPSYWQQDCDRIQIKRQKQQEKLKHLNGLIQSSRFNLEFVNSDFLNTMQKFSKSKKSSSGIRKNIKTLFTLALATSNFASLSQSHSNINMANSKFARLIKKNTAYLVCVFYENGRVLTTCDENLPIIEIEENYTMQNINNDFHFLIKLSYNWHEIDLFKTLIEQTISTSSLRFRYLILSAIKQMQSLLEINDLGRVYYKYLKNVSSSSTFFVLVRHKSNLKRLNFSQAALKTQEVESLLNKLSRVKARSTNLSNSSDYADSEFNFLFRHLKNFIEFNTNSHNKLSRGLYVAYLKLQSNIEHVKVMVPYRVPNMLPCQKVRDNPNVSREEWNLLKSAKQNINNLSINELNSMDFLNRVVNSIDELCKKLGDDESLSLRVIIHYVIEISANVSIIVVCPPLEQICVMQLNENEDAISISSSASSSSSPTTEYKDLQVGGVVVAASCPLLPTPSPLLLSSSSQNQSTICCQFSHIFLPVQFFEAINFYTYDEEFIRSYVRISVLLEIESLASLQFSREAFSNDEINRSKRISNIVCTYMKQLEDIWKESRWILDLISMARDKSPHSTNVILYKELKSFLSIVTDESRRMVVTLSNNNNNNGDCNCSSSRNTNDLRRNIFKPCKNIYNNITQLSDNTESICHLHVSPIKYHHIDSVLIDDDEILNSFNSDNQTTTNINNNNTPSMEEIRFLKPPSNHSIKSRNKPAKSEISNKDKNIQKLISKLYISSPNNNQSITNMNDDLSSTTTTTTTTTTINKENAIKIKISSPPDTVNMTAVSRHKILVAIDFETCLKIDVLFECMVFSNTAISELIFQIIKKLNSYIYCFNMINKSEDMNIFGSEWEQENIIESGTNSNSDHDHELRLKSNSPVCLIEERPDLYYLVACCSNGLDGQFEERVISDNLLSNGDIYTNNAKYFLRRKEHFF